MIIPRDAFTDRLDLLEESGQVSIAARRQTRDFVTAAEAAFGVVIDEQHGAMLVTHLAMALTRSERGAPLSDQPPLAVADEIARHAAERRFVRERLDGYAAEGGVTLPDAEYVFVTAHLCALTLAS